VLSESQESALAEKKDFKHRDGPYLAMMRYKKGFIPASDAGYLMVFDATSAPASTSRSAA
jgi:hypothetical protein